MQRRNLKKMDVVFFEINGCGIFFLRKVYSESDPSLSFCNLVFLRTIILFSDDNTIKNFW